MSIYRNMFNHKYFVHGGKGTFQNYNADQKAAIKALPKTADPNDYYLFFTDCYNRLDTAGNMSPEAVNGYMPVGRHYGFIYNEYTNARTIAHELGHGTNSLHHTFSQESESFYTTEKTDNLMDYNGGEYLNHRQWQWAHEKHRNVLGFLDDEEESEARNNDNERILSILKEIREANQKDEAMLNISVNQSMTYTIDVPNINFTLGEGTLSYLKIENDKLSITETETTIAPNELSEVVLEDKEYTKIVFHKTTSVGISEDVAFSIIVKTKEKQTLISYIHPYKITTEQLSNIYPNASTQTIKAVTEAINKYCNEFEINTPERMAHFLGQIGAETGDKLSDMVEKCNYSESTLKGDFARRTKGRIVAKERVFKRLLNADLWNDLSQTDDYYFPEYDKKICIDTIYHFTTEPIDVKNAEIIIKPTINTYYVNGANNCALFDYVYCCNKSGLGNNDYASQDGTRFRGRGFIQLTGRWNYENLLYKPWKNKHPNETRTVEKMAELLGTDIDLAIQVAMVYWSAKNVNAEIGTFGYVENEVVHVSAKVNGGSVGLKERIANTKQAYEVLEN